MNRVLRTAVVLALLTAAVWGVLESGRGLRAPPPFPERWVIREGCDAEEFTLSQSGIYLHGTGASRTLDAKLDGDRMSARVSCGVGTARLVGTWSPAKLEARVEAAGCGCQGTLVAEPVP